VSPGRPSPGPTGADARPPRIAFAGDRQLAVDVLDHLLELDVRPLALLVSSPQAASHAEQLIQRCEHLDEEHVWRGRAFRQPVAAGLFRSLDLDLLVSVHFPYLIPPEILEIPRRGCLNLHPALLPYNRGWHTATWGILEGTPVGATLHQMDEGVDSGPIVHQRAVEVGPGDTAASIYPRLLATELQVFKEAWPAVAESTEERREQVDAVATTHSRRDLFDAAVQRLDLAAERSVGDVLRQLRALTTSRLDEAAYFESEGRRFRVQVEIVEEPEA
jgi:methionyl-tRNA formyltransferase